MTRDPDGAALTIRRPAPVPELALGGPRNPPPPSPDVGLSPSADEPFKLGDRVVDEDGDECVISAKPEDGSSFVLVYYSLPHCKGEFEIPASSLRKVER